VNRTSRQGWRRPRMCRWRPGGWPPWRTSMGGSRAGRQRSVAAPLGCEPRILGGVTWLGHVHVQSKAMAAYNQSQLPSICLLRNATACGHEPGHMVTRVWRRMTKLCLHGASQLFWPDDNKWYLIQVQSVNPKARTAKYVAPKDFLVSVPLFSGSTLWIEYRHACTDASTQLACVSRVWTAKHRLQQCAYRCMSWFSAPTCPAFPAMQGAVYQRRGGGAGSRPDHHRRPHVARHLRLRRVRRCRMC